MPDIMMRLGREVLVFEGAMGTMLQRAGLRAGELPELLNVTAPEMVANVHEMYKLGGADAAMTNTFGGSRVKLAEWGYEDRVEEFNRAAVRIAKQSGAVHVLADMGPTGLVLEPLGTATFDEVFDAFAEQAAALAAEQPDAIFFETMTDIAEARCGVLAARSITDLPIFVSCTFGSSGRMDLSGTDPATAAVILEAAGASAIGLNCGLGPDQMLPLLEEMVAATSLPVIVQPNAGMPTLDSAGNTVFPGTPDEFFAWASKAHAAGAAAIGSCCGSTPAFTAEIAAAVADTDVVAKPSRSAGVVVAGPRGMTRIGGDAEAPVRVIGERINPTGKKALAAELAEQTFSIARAFAVEQQEAGADLLDVNVGAPGIDEADVLPKVVLALVGTTDLPLVLDSSDPAALEAALRIYPGRALVNSVNGDPASMDAVLPVAARYGAALVVLSLDETGIPQSAEGRTAVVEKIRNAAHELGIRDDALVVDSLVMTAAADETAPRTTIDAMRAARQMGLATVLGVSNVSHGLPNRPLLNAAFLEVAAANGLSAAIVNPNDHVVMETVRVANQARAAGSSIDAHGDAWTAWDTAHAAALRAADEGVSAMTAAESPDAAVAADPSEALVAAVMRGDTQAAPGLVDNAVESGTDPSRIVGDLLTPAIQRMGDAYGRGEVFLPQMMVAADAMKAAVARAKTYLPESADSSEGRVVFATVKGDIHSIGKDICISLLESQGFDVEDLGVDVDAKTVAAAAAHADVVCLSALMTTTLRSMGETVAHLRDVEPQVPVLVGGAVVTAEWAAEQGAGYSSDAPSCVTVVREAVRSTGER